MQTTDVRICDDGFARQEVVLDGYIAEESWFAWSFHQNLTRVNQVYVSGDVELVRVLVCGVEVPGPLSFARPEELLGAIQLMRRGDELRFIVRPRRGAARASIGIGLEWPNDDRTVMLSRVSESVHGAN